MHKSMYSTDFIWYNEGVHNAIMSLDAKYPNAIPVFGGALGAYDYINCDNPDFHKFAMCLSSVAHNATFFHWHEGVVGALRRFCHLCLVDPDLVELYLGMSLAELCEVI